MGKAKYAYSAKVAKLKEGTRAVESATANLAVDTRRVIEQISNIGKK